MAGDLAARDRRLDDAEREPGGEGPEGLGEADEERRDEALHAEERPGRDRERPARRGSDRDHARRARRRARRPAITYGSSGTPTIRAPSGVLRDRLQPAPEARPADEQRHADREHDPERDHEQRAQLEGRAADRDDPVVPGAVERERVGEDVRRPDEERRARSAWIANAIATVAATQPSVDPRARYGWMNAQ